MHIPDVQQRVKAKLDNLITLAVAARLVPGRSGKGVSICTIWRWTTRGVRGHVLFSTLVGGARFTSIAAIEAFIAATNGAQITTLSAHNSVDTDAIKKLTEAGVL